MTKSPRDQLENTLYLWSTVQNTIIEINQGDIIGRSIETFKSDEYLDKEHLKFEVENGKWFLIGQETTNGTNLNDLKIEANQREALSTSDIISAGDQVFFVLGRDLTKISTREEFLATIKIKSEELAEQVKSVQVRSVAFFKLEYPNFIKKIKIAEFEYKIEIATAKKANDIKPFNEKIAELTAKKKKIESAWDNKIQEFKSEISKL